MGHTLVKPPIQTTGEPGFTDHYLRESSKLSGKCMDGKTMKKHTDFTFMHQNKLTSGPISQHFLQYPHITIQVGL